MSAPGDVDEPLPGLEPAQAGTVGEVERAARRTIAALVGVLDDRHALTMQTVVTLARQLDRAAGSAKSKDYGVANLAAQLREFLALLLPEETTEGGAGDEWDELARELRAAARNAEESVSAE